uniref:Necdin isoform B n=1 Tax=Homo sapiens TaxID=9606 RepID=X5D2Y6_HUMAN|nr:necdin isoform B [Homo sapiens]
MSEQSKDLSDPNFAAEAPNSEVHSSPGVSEGVPPSATLAEPQSPPLGPTAAPQAAPPPQAPNDEGDPKALQQAAEEGRAHQASWGCGPGRSTPPSGTCGSSSLRSSSK